MPNEVRVTGIPENQRALKQAGNVDTEKAGTEAARDLLPYLKDATRTGDTGRLMGGWEAERGAFINEVDYAGYQEFGTVYIEPMGAIAKTVDQHEEVIERAFGKEVDRAADKAGLGG